MADKSLSILLMDPPYESESTTTAFRIISEAQKKGIKVQVFTYEGAVSLTVNTQKPHANAPKGCADERGHEGNMVTGSKRGSPGDFVKAAAASTNVLIIPTR